MPEIHPYVIYAMLKAANINSIDLQHAVEVYSNQYIYSIRIIEPDDDSDYYYPVPGLNNRGIQYLDYNDSSIQVEEGDQYDFTDIIEEIGNVLFP